MMDYAILDDLALQSLAVSGDRDAEEALAARYLRLVRICARPLFLVGGDSEDLIQEGTFGLLSAIRRYDPADGASFSTYAERCIRMRLLSAIKSASRLKHVPLNDGISLEQLSEDPGTDILSLPELVRHNPEDLILAKESKEELRAASSRCLSKFEIRVLDLYLEGLSYREIAERLCRNAKSVDNAVQRIRRKLAREMNLGDISIS
ncbi:MAG: sigma-70 family RNA polymerase sigma factor [Oscillospiraceae bacterium]|nr:sigma-70 family RNA polymerase sigma factor [Oscillospiraceae bacterium]